MIVIWKGMGIVALCVPVLALITFVAFLDGNKKVGGIATGAMFAIGGVVCVYLDRLGARKQSGGDSLYWIPLRIYGWAYFCLGLFLCGAMTVGLVQHGFKSK